MTLLLAVLSGCGGGGVSPNGISPLTKEFYRGSVTYASGSGMTGSQPIVATIPDSNYILAFSPTQTITVGGAVIFQEWYTINRVSANQIDFTKTNAGVTVMSGTLQRTQLPALGKLSITPPSGTYTGDLVAMGANGVAGYSTVTATVQSDGTFSATATDEVFYGAFGANQNLPYVTLTSNGSAITETSAQFSFDGTTLILRIDLIGTTPQSAWITLTKTS